MYTSRRSTALVVSILALTLLTLTACSGGGSNEEPEPPAEDTTPPSAPSGFAATSGDGEVELDWNAVDASDLDGYNVYRATESFSSVESMTPVNGSLITETTFADSDVSNGTTYHYRITAMDTNGNESSASGEIEVTPFPSPPDRP